MVYNRDSGSRPGKQGPGTAETMKRRSVMRCGKCKESHDTVAEVRACYGMMQDAPGSSRKSRTSKVNSPVPSGHYATLSATGNNDLDFWKVNRPTEGKWAGWVFVYRVIGGRPDQRITYKSQESALKAIESHGIEESGALYGWTIGRCYKCNRHLTDETSRTLGIGPDCRSQLSKASL
jgi:hypothetical protein